MRIATIRWHLPRNGLGAVITRLSLAQRSSRLAAVVDQGPRLLESHACSSLAWTTAWCHQPPLCRATCGRTARPRMPDTRARGTMPPSPHFCGRPCAEGAESLHLQADQRILPCTVSPWHPNQTTASIRKSAPGITIFNVLQHLHLGLARY